MRILATVAILGCQSRPAPAPAPVEVVTRPIAADAAVDTRPRCIQAGGVCVGPAAIAANPRAPCAAGMHRVDDVAIPGNSPACLGIPLGEEACCIK